MAENKTTQKTVEGVMFGKTISESVEEVNAKYKKLIPILATENYLMTLKLRLVLKNQRLPMEKLKILTLEKLCV